MAPATGAAEVGRTVRGSGWGNHELDLDRLSLRDIKETQVEMWYKQLDVGTWGP